MKWQSIEDAPTDGTNVIGLYWDGAFERKGDLVRCWWQPEFDAFISSARVMQMHNGYSFGDGSTERMHSPVIETPSHFILFCPPMRMTKPFDIGELSPPGERLQVSLATDAHALKRLITGGKIAPQRELIEDARDVLTDILQWMDESDV